MDLSRAITEGRGPGKRPPWFLAGPGEDDHGGGGGDFFFHLSDSLFSPSAFKYNFPS